MAKNKRRLKCPLFIAIALSMAIAGGYYVYDTYFKAPAVATVETVAEAEAPEEVAEAGENIPAPTITPESTSTPTPEITPEVTEAETSEEEAVEEEEKESYWDYTPLTIEPGTVTQYVAWNDNPARSPYYRNSNVRPLSTDYPYKTVDGSYFDNSLFIGDSRIAGLHDYSGWENATFAYKVGLTVYDMMTAEIRTGSGKSTVLDVLGSRQFENIYIMIGINELGTGTVSDFSAQYRQCLEIIRTLQPKARIIIMGIMFETTAYSDADDVYNNDNINAKNSAIAGYANGKDIFYLDMNPAVCDETNGLREDISFDGVHLTAKYYYLWTDFMLSHAY